MLDAILGFLGRGVDTYMSNQNAQANRESQERIARENIANQREFAQQGIRWKVADAEAAGLHPLAALGAQTSSFSNVVGADVERKTSFGDMGQDLGRAIDAGSTAPERSDRMGAAIARTAQVFSLEKLNLENELLKSQVAKSNAQLPPALPSGALAHLSRSPNRTADGHAISDDDVKQKAGDAPQNRNYKLFGVPMNTNPRFSDGEDIGDHV